MGVEVSVEGLTKSFGSQNIWRDVLDPAEGEVSALLGPSGTGKSVFLKTLIGLLHPEQGSVIIDGTDITKCSARELYEIQAVRRPLPGRRAVRFDEPLRQHRLPAARAHQV